MELKKKKKWKDEWNSWNENSEEKPDNVLQTKWNENTGRKKKVIYKAVKTVKEGQWLVKNDYWNRRKIIILKMISVLWNDGLWWLMTQPMTNYDNENEGYNWKLIQYSENKMKMTKYETSENLLKDNWPARPWRILVQLSWLLMTRCSQYNADRQ